MGHSERAGGRLSSRMKRVVVNLVILAAGLALVTLYSTSATGSPATGAAFLAFGFVVAAYGTMVGVGGGFLIVPALLLVFNTSHPEAAGTSLVVVFLNAMSGSFSYARQKRIDFRAGLVFSLACLPGGVAGAFMSNVFSGRTFNVVFGVLLLSISGLLLWRPAKLERPAGSPIPDKRKWHFVRTITDADGTEFVYSYNWLVGVTLSFFVGFLSSALGIGGGIIYVPMMVYLLGFPPHLATATSQVILASTAAVGSITYLSLGQVLLWPAAIMGVGVIGGARVGARLGKRIKGPHLLRLLAIAMVLVAIRLILD